MCSLQHGARIDLPRVRYRPARPAPRGSQPEILDRPHLNLNVDVQRRTSIAHAGSDTDLTATRIRTIDRRLETCVIVLTRTRTRTCVRDCTRTRRCGADSGQRGAGSVSHEVKKHDISPRAQAAGKCSACSGTLRVSLLACTIGLRLTHGIRESAGPSGGSWITSCELHWRIPSMVRQPNLFLRLG